jgi:DNA-binding HxlR family transcriptional regulator
MRFGRRLKREHPIDVWLDHAMLALMLTVTLRALERDGLIVRHIYPVIPPRVEYSLTPLGRSLLEIVEALVTWSADHINDVEGARYRYDSSHQADRAVSSSA